MSPIRAAPFLRGWTAAVLAAAAPLTAQAHPLDEVVQGAYLTLKPGQVALELDISPGILVADSLLRRLDADGDTRIGGDEADAFGRHVLGQTRLTIDGAPAAWRLERVAAPPYDNVRQGGDTVRIYAVARRPERAGAHSFTFENRYAPARTQAAANVFLQPNNGWRYTVAGQAHGPDGRSLSVRYTAAR